MNLQEFLDEYAIISRDDEDFYPNTERMQEIIKEIEASIRKETLIEYLEWERRYWVDIFDNKPYRYRLVESDNWTMNIARIEIDRIDKELEKLK